MLSVEDAFVVFYARTPLERVALRGVSFSVKDGEVVSILGHAGSGRSTLLKFLAGHLRLNFGRLWLNNFDITSQSLVERSRLISSVFGDYTLSLAGSLTVLENLAAASMHSKNKSMFKSAINKEIKDRFYDQLKNLNFMDMESLLDEEVRYIATPYKQVLALMIAVIKGAKVLVIDEHSVGLDAKASKALLEATHRIIRARRITTIMTSNNPEFDLRKSDRIMIMNQGQLVADFAGEEKKKLKLEDLPSMFNKTPLVTKR